MRYDTAVLARGLAVVFAFAACAREPAESVCPEATTGALVVTEVHGDTDDGQPWVELYNDSGGTLDLLGTRIRFRRRDGTEPIKVIVRHELDVAAGSYIVLGAYADEGKPPFIDYGFAGDFMESWRSSGVIDVEACEASLDRLLYDSLPTTGTYSLGGTPTEEANDLPANWCTDPDPAGSPGEANIACP